MGAVYDLERIDHNPRCSDIKEPVIILNLLGSCISILVLAWTIIRMGMNNKEKSFLTQIIMFIFSTEILNPLSKLLQLFKYAFEDTRTKDDINEIETPRGIICQIQIVTSIIADVCTLLGTLLLSYRSYEIIRGERKIFDRKIEQILSFIIIILTSIIFSITFLFFDKILTKDSITYKFDLRDRCNYCCWLDHLASIICHIFYLVPLGVNIMYELKIIFSLQKSYYQISGKNDNDDQNYLDLENDDRLKLKEIRIMQIKCIFYPAIIIIIWILLLLYRFFDDIAMYSIDRANSWDKGEDDEVNYFNDHPGLRISFEITFILYTIVSSFRGVLYGIAFVTFEEKYFCNFFRNCCLKFFCCCCCCYCCKNCLKIPELDDLDENNNEIIRESSAPDNLLKNNIKEGGEINENEAN
jgi:hypothetical protein